LDDGAHRTPFRRFSCRFARKRDAR
jgi:hypothetical protein